MTVKTLTDLTGLEDKQAAELEAMGIKSVQDLSAALDDEERVKDIIKALSAVGPRTVAKWKDELAGASDAGRKSEVVEEGEEPAYAPKAKAKIDEATQDALAKRAAVSGRRPAFKRQEWFRYAKLGEAWRRPKGIHSKMRRHMKRRPPMVDIGYRGPAAARGLHPSGFEEVMVHRVADLEGVDPARQAVRVGGTVGTKKRIEIQDRAESLGIRVLNRMV